MKAVVYPWLHTDINPSNKEELLSNLNFFFVRDFDTIIIPFGAKNGKLQIYVATSPDNSNVVTLTSNPYHFPHKEEIAEILLEYGIASAFSDNIKETVTAITDKVKDMFINFLIDNEIINRFTNNLIKFRSVNMELYINDLIKGERPAETLLNSAFPFDGVPEDTDFWIEYNESWIKTLAE